MKVHSGYMNILRSFICNCQRLETSHISTSKWLDKQTVVYPYNEILLRNKKEWTIDKLYYVNKSQNYTEWKTQDPPPKKPHSVHYMIPFM